MSDARTGNGCIMGDNIAQQNRTLLNLTFDTAMDHSQNTRDRKTPTEILDLSTEVRELIYEDVFNDAPSIFVLHSRMRHSPLTFWKMAMPGICFVNRRIHAEALRTWFRCTLFIVNSESSQVIGFDKFCTKYNLWKELRYLKFAVPR